MIDGKNTMRNMEKGPLLVIFKIYFPFCLLNFYVSLFITSPFITTTNVGSQGLVPTPTGSTLDKYSSSKG